MSKKARDRWKCPDCSGWVRDDIEVHKCEVAAITLPNAFQWTGWTCTRCGMFVSSNTFHSCWVYNTPPSTPYWYTSTANNTSNVVYKTYTTYPKAIEDDGSADVGS